MISSIDLSEVMGRSDDVCAHEPIHLVGAVQPHGVLIGFDPATMAPVTRSANADTVFGVSGLADLAGRLPQTVMDAMRHLWRGGGGLGR